MTTSDRHTSTDVLYEIGRQVQKTALLMRAHVLMPLTQVCACGRIPIRLLPYFGLRCEVACQEWDLMTRRLRKLLEAIEA